MSQVITTQDLINDVRSMIDESNQTHVDDTADILPALNRAQNYATNILSRHYNTPLLTHKYIATVGGQEEYALPSDIFENKVEYIDMKVGNQFHEIDRKPYRLITSIESLSSTVSIPIYWSPLGNKFRLFPAANGSYPLRMWYLRTPMRMVKPQGRITAVNATSLIIDSIGSLLTSDSTNLYNYIHVIDAFSGERKATYQISSISASANQINLNTTTPTRSSVLGYTVDTSTSSLLINTVDALSPQDVGPTYAISPDDYICVVQGTCIPFFKQPFSNFLIEYASTELRRGKLGEQMDINEKDILNRLEDQVNKSWVGQIQTIPVVQNDRNWPANKTRRRIILN